MCRQHEVLRGAAAIEGCFGVSRSSAKQDQSRRIPEDLEVRPFSPRPRTTVGLMVVRVLLGANAKARQAFNAFDHTQSPRVGAARRRRRRLHGGVQQVFEQGSIDRIRTVRADGPPRVNGCYDVNGGLRCGVFALTSILGRQEVLLLGRAGHCLQPVEPGERRVLPDLNGGPELSALIHATEANDDGRWVVGRCSVQRRTAFGAEHLCSAIAALSDLDVTLRLTVDDEASYGRCDDCTERRTRKDLAVRAVAHHCARGVDLGCEGDQAAVTSAVDMHDWSRGGTG